MKEELEKALFKIGYSIRGQYPNAYIINHKKKNTGIRVLGDRLEPNKSMDDTFDISFYFKDCEIYELETNGKIDCVGLKAKSNNDVFIQFYNHDK